jgi:cation transporter-like permease
MITIPDGRTETTGRVTASHVLAAEWIKARGTRSTWWLVGGSIASIAAAGISPALTFVLANDTTSGVAQDATGGALNGVSFTQLLVAAFGVLVVSSEYGSGLVRATFTAVPARLPVLVGKAVVVAVLTVVATSITALATFGAARAVLDPAGVHVSLSTPGVLRAVLGAALFLAVSAVFGTAFGWIVRSTAGALAATVGFLFLLPVVGLLLPGITPYLPSNAGTAVMQVGSGSGLLPPWVGFGLFTAYAVVALATAALLVRRRDA